MVVRRRGGEIGEGWILGPGGGITIDIIIVFGVFL